MPKDPKRNLQRYQIQGGHLNEFEFQKSQSELADSDLRFTDQRGEPDLSQAERVAAVTADAHRKVEKRKQPSTAKAQALRILRQAKAHPGK